MGKLKVLLVDDEPDFLELIGARIEGWGYELSKAKNGEEAIGAVKNKSCDLMILDYMMPDMDGISTLKKIRKIDADIPVIMFTAHPSSENIKDSNDLNISAFIPKLSIYSDVNSSLKAAIEMARSRFKGKKKR